MTPSRRAFLRGAGATLALPFLPSLAGGAAPVSPRRLVFVMWDNGAPMDRFTPTAAGAGWEATPLLAPLERHRNELTIWSGFGNAPAAHWQGGGHSEGFASWLTAKALQPSLSIENDISVDQAAVPLVGSGRVLPSLQVSLEKGGTGGTCPALFPCAYDVSISWQGRGRPLAPVDDPQLLFDRIFPTTVEARVRARRASLLDLVREDAAALRPKLGGDDAQRLDSWLEGVRHVESRLQAAASLSVPERPATPVDDEGRIGLVFDLITQALRTDATRVVSLTLGRAASERMLPGFDTMDHHAASHHRGSAATYDVWTGYTAWTTEQVARLIDRLDAADGERLLDSTLLVAGSPMGEGMRHIPYDLPLVTAGRLGGLGPAPGHRVVEADRPLADLWLGLLRTLGDSRTSFGDDGADAVSFA